MSKYNIDNGETAIVDKIKHYDKRNQAENLNRQLLTKEWPRLAGYFAVHLMTFDQQS